MGILTTHVLDTANGKPAADVPIKLHRLEAMQDRPGAMPVLLASTLTNGDGRCNAPLLQGAAFTSGQYTLTFRVADYFRAQGLALADPPFLDNIVIHFAIAATDQHYHVPLLVSPWSYSTYRGS